MTKLEEKLLAQIRARLAELDVRASDKLAALLSNVNDGQVQPTMLLREEKAADFSFRPILQYGPTTESHSYPTFTALLDAFYQARETADQVKQKGQDFLKSLNQARERLVRKMALQ